MGINKDLFTRIYEDCKKIVECSGEENMKLKIIKLEKHYKEMIAERNYKIQEFYAIAHEIRTYEFLRNNNLLLGVQNDNKPGPDYFTTIGYVECVTFMPPEGATNRKIISGNFNRYRVFEPRVSQAISGKKEKYDNYTEKENIGTEYPRIIFLSSGLCGFEINSSSFCGILLKILFGGGNPVLKSGRIVENCRKSVKSIEKITNGKNGNEISVKLEVDYFDKEEYSNISAVLFTDNLPNEEYKSLFLFLNHKTNIKINKKILRNIEIIERNKDMIYIYKIDWKILNENINIKIRKILVLIYIDKANIIDFVDLTCKWLTAIIYS